MRGANITPPRDVALGKARIPAPMQSYDIISHTYLIIYDE
jgi:hypothetical protein